MPPKYDRKITWLCFSCIIKISNIGVFYSHYTMQIISNAKRNYYN